jgi:hypothetical protein
MTETGERRVPSATGRALWVASGSIHSRRRSRLWLRPTRHFGHAPSRRSARVLGHGLWDTGVVIASARAVYLFASLEPWTIRHYTLSGTESCGLA